MKILKKIMILTLVMITIIFSLIPPEIVNAASSQQIGEAIASTAEDFFDRFEKDTIYDYGKAGGYDNPYIGHVDCDWSRNQAYQNVMTSGTAYSSNGTEFPYKNKYAMDCVGFVSMIVHRATGYGGDSFSFFGVPGNCTGNDTTNFEVKIIGISITEDDIQRGDILYWYGHVAIAIGDGMMIDSGAAGNNRSITKRTIAEYTGELTGVIRPRANVNCTEENLNYTWYENPNILQPDGTIKYGEGSSDTENDLNKFVPEVRKYGIGDTGKFYYHGMPISGEYLGIDTSNWLIDALEDVADWLAGVITLGYKVQIVGWSTVIQNLATGLVSSIVSEDIDQAITAEKILFNEVQILDVNFFNFETAGGQNITEDDIVYTLKQNVASVYFSVRSIVIIVLLVILIYVGIRMALSTISRDKAKYKKMFFGWCVGFIVVMFIHYFMVVIIEVNEQIVGFFVPETDTTIVYDQARSYAYEISATKGWSGTLLYVFLVYYMIKLLIFYFKRLLVVYILAVIAPILGASYAIEMVKGKSKSLVLWMKEFAFNIIIQSVHIITYCVFMNIIYSKIMNSLNILNLIPYAVIMILVLNLLLRTEKMIKNIFGMKSTTMKDIIDTVLKASGTLMTAKALVRPLYSLGKKEVLKAYDKSVEKRVNDKYKHLEQNRAKANKGPLTSDAQKEIDRLKQEEIDRIKEFDANALNLTSNVFSGLGGMVKSVPMMFEAGPAEGVLNTVNAIGTYNSDLKEIDDFGIDGERIDELRQKYGMQPLENSGIANDDIEETDDSGIATNARYATIKK